MLLTDGHYVVYPAPHSTFRTNTALAGGVTVQKPDLFGAVGLPTYGASVVFVQDGVSNLATWFASYPPLAQSPLSMICVSVCSDGVCPRWQWVA